MEKRPPDEMPLSGHLKELRERLLKALIAVLIGFAASWVFAPWILDFLSRPIQPYLSGTEGRLIFTGPLEKFLSYIKVSLMAGVFLSSPYWLFQIWAFLSPGLHKGERKQALIFAGLGGALFIFGAAFAYGAVYPLAFKFLMEFGGGGEAPFISLKEYLAFVMRTALVFALVFELPLAAVFLIKMKIISPAALSAARPYIIVGTAVLSALVTPPDIVSMLLMMAPLYLLFELSFYVGRKIAPPA